MRPTLAATLWLMLVASASCAAPNDTPGTTDQKDEAQVRKTLPTAEEIAKLPPDGGPEFNRLIHESSPYLLQHARNPVDWYAWSDEAFARARDEGKAVFLSIGYSTCHWCHVMERESFENEKVAALMNELFVCVKVDREERPDVDAIYMAAVQSLTGRGGWPMSVFLTPDRKPFWAGTYFPPDDRHGTPGFTTVLRSISKLWEDRRADVHEAADELTKHLAGGVLGAPRGEGAVELTTATLAKCYGMHLAQFDSRNGGFGGAPKFPRSFSLSFLCRWHARAPEPRALAMVEATLDAMARGGIHDQLGGGFHRYSTDAEWLVPHFEKMLYDQALLARSYIEGFQVTKREEYARVARGIFDYVLRDMTDAAGGFHSAEDADSEGVEGKFYVWKHAEIVGLIGAEAAGLFARVYGVNEKGNFEEEATGEDTGENILHWPRTPSEVAAEMGIDVATLEARLAPMRRTLFEAREKRIRPHKDDKVLADWNALMISSLAGGSRALGERRYLEAAERAASFILERMMRDGRLLHTYRGGTADVPAYLDDYAFLGLALVDLYEASFDERWLVEARRLASEMVRLFWDAEGKGFFFAGSDGESLITKTKELYDGAAPSGNSAALVLLERLSHLTGDIELGRRADEALASFSSAIDSMPIGYPFALGALDWALGPTMEIVLAGDPADPVLLAMRREVDQRFLPTATLLLRAPGPRGDAIAKLAPFLADLKPVGGKAAAYVCSQSTCEPPITDASALAARLDRRP